jgi:hypothetical protein
MKLRTMRYLRIVHAAIGIFALLATPVFARDFRDNNERDSFRTEVSARETSREYTRESIHHNFSGVSMSGKSAGAVTNGMIVSIDSETGIIYRYGIGPDGKISTESVRAHAGKMPDI